MRKKLLAELPNMPDILFPVVFFGQAAISFHQTAGKICRTIAHGPFKLIDHRSYLAVSESGMIEKLDKPMDGLLVVNIVLPKGIICIDQEMVAHLVSLQTPVPSLFSYKHEQSMHKILRGCQGRMFYTTWASMRPCLFIMIQPRYKPIGVYYLDTIVQTSK